MQRAQLSFNASTCWLSTKQMSSEASLEQKQLNLLHPSVNRGMPLGEIPANSAVKQLVAYSVQVCSS